MSDTQPSKGVTVLGRRTLTGPEMVGVMADLTRDFKGTVAALRNATPETEARRAALAEHCMHRVELRREDGTVAARGELISATVCGAHFMFVEAGHQFVALAEIHGVVRLQPVRDLKAVLAERREKARGEREEQAELDAIERGME